MSWNIFLCSRISSATRSSKSYLDTQSWWDPVLCRNLWYRNSHNSKWKPFKNTPNKLLNRWTIYQEIVLRQNPTHSKIFYQINNWEILGKSIKTFTFSHTTLSEYFFSGIISFRNDLDLLCEPFKREKCLCCQKTCINAGHLSNLSFCGFLQRCNS